MKFWYMFSFKNDNKNELKEHFLKAYFNSADQKKSILKAAQESAADQRKMMEQYKDLLEKESVTC